MSAKNRLAARRCRDPVSHASAALGPTALVRLYGRRVLSASAMLSWRRTRSWRRGSPWRRRR